MSQEDKCSILDELANCSGYDIALMTTFSFEISFFERAVLNRLYAKDVKKISLFVDSKELDRALQDVDTLHMGSHIGRKYMVNPVRMNSSFHPKVILLLGEKKARLFVGSANIKTSGYSINNEIFNFIDYNPEHPEYLDVIVAAIDFFHDMNKVSYQLDNDILKAAKDYIYYHKAKRNGEVYLLQNMTAPILEQAADLIAGDVESISIAVPYYDKELVALQIIKQKYPNADIHLYIQNERSTFQVVYNDEKRIVEHIDIFSRFKNNPSSSGGNFYHGKVFLFKTKDASYILYGSANCTQAALTRSYARGGNIECDLFEVGSLTDFDYFFDNMELTKGEKLIGQVIVYEKTEPANFTFKYGEAKGDLELHIAYSKVLKALEITVGEQTLEYKLEKDELIVMVPEEFRNVLSDIFDITISYEDGKENIRCWTFSPTILANYRGTRSNKNELNGFDIDSTGDKYLEDRINFFKAEVTCLTEWQEYKKNQIYMNQIKQEQQGDDEEANDFIVDFQIPDVYRYAYKQYNAASKIRGMFIHRFLGTAAVFSEKTDGKSTTKKYDVESKKPQNRKPRKATSAEKSFERFIKGKVNGMMNDVYVNVIEVEHYIGLVAVVFEIFEKYSRKELVENIFTPDYIVKTKIGFLSKIIGKDIEENAEYTKLRSAVIAKSFSLLLENYRFYKALSDRDEAWEYMSLNRSFLNVIEKKYNLRQGYENYIKQLLLAGDENAIVFGYNAACAYIEELYGYKNYSQLCDYIAIQYGEAAISIKDSSLYINAQSENIREHDRPNIEVLKEIAKYSRNVSKISSVYVTVKNVGPNSGNKNVIDTVKHFISLEYHQWRSSEKRLNGDTIDTKLQYISF